MSEETRKEASADRGEEKTAQQAGQILTEAPGSGAAPEAVPAAVPAETAPQPAPQAGEAHGAGSAAVEKKTERNSAKDRHRRGSDEQQESNECRNAANEASFVHPADLADHLENLDLKSQVCALRRMPREDAADVLDELDESHRDVLLGRLAKEDSEELRNLLNFPQDSAAGVMNTEVIMLEESWTVDQAISHIRSEMELEKESPYYGYVVDEKEKLVGVLSLRDLMLAKPGIIVGGEVAGQNVVSVRYDMDKREVASELSHYNYMALPVVDYENHLMGVVTYDDIMDIMHEEASADMLGMVGAGPEENIDTPWYESVAKRLPWLGVNLVNSALSASVVYRFDGTIAQMAVLAVLMPMVANQGGNSGQQALAVMIRQLASEKVDRKKAIKAVLREGKIGFITGFAMAIVAFIGSWIFSHNMIVGMVMGGAMLCDMVLGAVAGGSIPLIFKALGRDPAQASSIFLTTITDGCGFFIFLGLATVFLF